MINVILTGVGGQGTVLAAKVLALAGASKGWNVCTAETIGMAQRGGSVISHVRLGNLGEQIHAPLVTKGTANLIIAFEPGEAARTLPYLAPDGTIITATTVVEPVTASISSFEYTSESIIGGLQHTLYNAYAHSLSSQNGRSHKAHASTTNSFDPASLDPEAMDGMAGMAAAGMAGMTGELEQLAQMSANPEPRKPRMRQSLISVDDKAIINALGGNRRVLNAILLAVAVMQNSMPLTVQDLKAAISACVKPQYLTMNIEAIDEMVNSSR